MARTQTPLSLRIDKETLARLDAFCQGTLRKRNEVINTAISSYLDNFCAPPPG